MNKQFSPMGSISTWKVIGGFLSITWIAVTSFLYIDNVVRYPHSYVEYANIPLYKYFGSEEDIERKNEGLKYAKDHGKLAEAEMMLAFGFKFLRPIFSILGYLQLVLFPILVGWFVALSIIVWNRHKSLLLLGYLLFLIYNNIFPLTFGCIVFCAMACMSLVFIDRVIDELI